jgi:hypothetical protein
MRLLRIPRGRQETCPSLPYKAIRGNTLVTDAGELWAVYRLGHSRWEFSSPEDRHNTVLDARLCWASLVGHRVQVRATSRLFPHAAWAEALDRSSVSRIRDQEETDESWRDYLAECQEAIYTDGLRVPAVYVSVRIAPRFKVGDLQYMGDRHIDTKSVREARKALAKVDQVVSSPGFNGVPVRNPKEIAWFIHASLAVGIPAPAITIDGTGITGRDMECFTAPVTVDSLPYAPAARVAANRGGRTITRWVSVLTAGLVQDRDLDALPPWGAFAAGLPYPVEAVATFDVVPGDAVTTSARTARERATDQEAHYAEHGQEAPLELARVIDTARRMEDETSTGSPEVAVRVIGSVRFAVTGATEDEVADRVQHLTGEYARHELIHLVHTRAQAALLGEFLPCAPRRIPGLDQWMSPMFASAAGWNTTPRPGTPSGPLLGCTITGVPQAVLFNAHYGPARNLSGLAVVTGSQGSGKSVLLGILAEGEARLGHQTVVVDPSGQLDSLTRLPHLRDVSHVVDLSKASRGTLNPYRLVPVCGDLDAEKTAQGERRALTQDALLMLVPPALLASGDGGSITEAVMRAVADAPAEATSTPWPVLDQLRTQGGVGTRVAKILTDTADQPGGRLLFPADDTKVTTTSGADAVLTVIATPGFTAPPPGVPREQWTRDEQVAAMVAHLATRYAVARMYSSKAPKLIVIDEAGLIGGSAAFQGFAVRCGRDSRKWNTLVAIASQNPADILALDSEIPNLVGCAWIGRVTGTAAESGLVLAGVPTGCGHEQTLGRLRAGEFLFRCWDSTAWTRIYLHHRPAIAAALNTTPASLSAVQDFDQELVQA